ncbi:hypothetical protein F5Y06DRAFT_264875 [Hypoxylon sp. FL0890]|nr:hypothetical protein F5Y06DRAFT_264875 [Hypoxylon sp. FL0890]
MSDPNGPVLPPPDGVESNLDNPPNGNALVNGLTAFFLAISLIFLIIRAYAKTIYMKNRPGLGDYVILPAIGTYTAGCVFIFRVAATSGFFVHGWDFRLKNLSWFYYNLFLGTIMYLATMIFLKAAILLEWARIFGPGSRRSFRWTCYILAAVNAAYYIINVSLECTSCTPRAYYWDKTIPGGHCTDAAVLDLVSAVVNLIFDLAILILPQGVIWRLNMSRRKRVGVSVVFIIGLLGCACATLRIAFGVAYVSSDDYTYELSKQSILCTAEATAGFLVFCAPAAPKPVLYLAQRAGESMDRLVRSTLGSGSDQRSAAATGTESATASQSAAFSSLFSRKRSKPNMYNQYREINEQSSVPLRKLSSTKSRDSKSSTQQRPPMP